MEKADKRPHLKVLKGYPKNIIHSKVHIFALAALQVFDRETALPFFAKKKRDQADILQLREHRIARNPNYYSRVSDLAYFDSEELPKPSA